MADFGKTKIVILGGGFGGAYCAQKLEKIIPADEVEVTLIDRNNYFVFYPLLVEAGTGDLEPRHAVVSIRRFLKKTSFRMAEFTNIDFKNRQVLYHTPGSGEPVCLHYDHLVLAPGSITFLPDIPGLKEYGYQMKQLADAVALRDRAIELLEIAGTIRDKEQQKRLLHFVVVGGNFTGVEVAGQFDEFFKQASKQYRNIDPADCQVTLLEITDQILTALDTDLSEFARDKMQERGIGIRLNSSVKEINPDYIVLDNGERIDTKTVVWCAGIAPSPIIKKLSLPVDERGYILCEKDLRVKGFKNVWAIGDSAVNPDPQGTAYPATAQHAAAEAKQAAKNIVRIINGFEPLPCRLSAKGALASLGCRTAVAKIFGIKIFGFWAWFSWRTVYLLKMPGWSRRIRVALDWTMDLLFRRDYVQLGVLPTDRN